MSYELAKQILGAWSRGALVAPGTLENTINILARSKRNRFVENCIRRCGALEGRRLG